MVGVINRHRRMIRFEASLRMEIKKRKYPHCYLKLIDMKRIRNLPNEVLNVFNIV